MEENDQHSGLYGGLRVRGAGPRPRGVGQSTEPEGSGNRGEDLLTGCEARGRQQTRTSTCLMDVEKLRAWLWAKSKGPHDAKTED